MHASSSLLQSSVRLTCNVSQEISKEEYFNPILQDTKKGKLRYVRNCFPHKGELVGLR